MALYYPPQFGIAFDKAIVAILATATPAVVGGDFAM
jgi:hypothetical protein